MAVHTGRARRKPAARPWICLVVVRKDAATLTAGAGQSLPVLECPRRELPNLSESWAWAHAQVVSGGATISEPLNHAALKQVLKGSPERTLSRLLCPRRLDPNTAYYVCVVPAFDVGRKAGLGESVTPEDEAAMQPAWSSTWRGADDRIKLPVYFHWEFSTGLAGDFESLARRLEPKPFRRQSDCAHGCEQPGLGHAQAASRTHRAPCWTWRRTPHPETNPRPWPDDARTSFQNRSGRFSTRPLHRIPPVASLPSSPRLSTGSGIRSCRPSRRPDLLTGSLN